MLDFLLSYDTITLSPRHSSLSSRSQADTSVSLCGYKFNLPVVPANMADVINPTIAKFLSENGYFYIYHRFGQSSDETIESDLNTVYFVKVANHENWKLISISTGVNNESMRKLMTIKALRLRVDFITIDVAHADHDNVKSIIEYVRENFPHTKVIVGNVATSDGVLYLCDLGVDVIKVGIGGGCFTPNTLVLTDSGYKPIQYVSILDKVLTHKNTFENVTNTFNENKDEVLIRINNKIECTKNHEFYVVHKNYEFIINEQNIHQYAKWIKAEELTDEYFLVEMGK